MVQFLTIEQQQDLGNYVTEIAKEIGQQIKMADAQIVKGGLFGDEIVEAIKLQFYPEYSQKPCVESTIKTMMHRYIFENDLGLVCELNIEKDVWNGKIRYNIIYTYAGDYHNCDDCKRHCKRGLTRCLYYRE